MVLNNNQKYKHIEGKQAGKNYSINKSKELVREIKKLFEPYLKECIEYEPNESLRINKAPAVQLKSGKLAIAPDLKCITKDNKVFWIEVKDKAQRVYFSDTGADLHQVLGWYDINQNLNEPVLVIFKDPDYLSCLPKSGDTPENIINNFKLRWNKFSGDYYGNWLTSLLKIDDNLKYPCIFNERSRNMQMNILYFHIDKMINIRNNISTIIKDIPSSIDEIKCYRRKPDKSKEKINQLEIRKLSI